MHVGVSVGIGFGSPGCESSDVVREADIAMYLAKNEGKGRYEIFQPAIHEQMLKRLALRASLEDAIERGDFVVHYQPIHQLESRRVVALEALVRWVHPDRGLVLPAEFIPVAEAHRAHRSARPVRARAGVPRHGGLGPLRGCRRREALGEPVTGPAPRHRAASRDQERAGRIRPRSGATDPRGDRERGADSERAAKVLQAIRALGIRIAIDDFGTGYSALGRLSSLPADHLKIDRSFIDVLGRSARETALTATILRVASELDLTTVAEGVERPDQVAQLAELGCTLAQGFLLSVPADAAETETLLRANSPRERVPHAAARQAREAS